MAQAIQSITIGISVTDVNKATQWYKTLLGDVETMEPAPGTVELQLADNVWLQLDDTGDIKVGERLFVLRRKILMPYT
jgi:catechol-2,3-dioxygenase